MENKSLYRYITITAALIVGAYFLILGLVEARAFLAPLVIATVLSLLIYPLCKKIEKKLSRSVSCLLSVFILFILSLGIVFLVSYQIHGFVEEWPSIKENMAPKVENLKNFLVQNTPISSEDVKGQNFDKISSKIKEPGSKALGFISGTTSFLTNYFLVFIYIFFILCYRKRFFNFLIKLFSKEHTHEVEKTSGELTDVVSQYLIGKLLLMGALAVSYSIGLGISGVENFILISLIAALLTLIPYIGNMIGFGLAFSFGYLVSGEIGVLIGVIITFVVSQFLESYVLQPYVIGERVNLHPFLVILMVIFWGSIWGISGMILAVPLTAILTTIMLHIPKLKIIGELFQNEPINEKSKKSD
ncbi:AI-2E family transporter [Mesonia aestuariivivens]|uniref:AI-2E family transporter n=1 Tax=Mesonia aestuariivivens TaxID=2796128 RepID=A0ABS6W1J0_9FLAO|nr:AI-2E family transporter [Mesonia aestuariivivens]MBW2961695.1 AI-2E family transporter [Mesonia aestuariivivens]